MLPLLALRTADLAAIPANAFEVEVRVAFDADAGEAVLEVLDYDVLLEEQRPHARHLANWVLRQGGWAAQVQAAGGAELTGEDEYGWYWQTTHTQFNDRAAGLNVANNRPGPTDSWYQLLSFSQQRVGESESQLLQYVFRAYPP